MTLFSPTPQVAAIRAAAIEALAVLVNSDDQARGAIVERMGSDPCWSVREAAIEALAVLANSDDQVRGALMECMTSRVFFTSNRLPATDLVFNFDNCRSDFGLAF